MPGNVPGLSVLHILYSVLHSNFNIPWACVLKCYWKRFKKYTISCHKNMKFLHIIADVFLNLMHKMWKSYMYLEPDTTNGNFEAGILKFSVTRRPLQFTHCTEIMYFRRSLWKSVVTFTSSNSFSCDSILNTAHRKVLQIIFGSTLYYVFTAFCVWPVLLYTDDKWELRFSRQLSMCCWNTVYGMVSYYKSASWTDSLILHLNFRSVTSK
jgi:hypothetical protein